MLRKFKTPIRDSKLSVKVVAVGADTKADQQLAKHALSGRIGKSAKHAIREHLKEGRSVVFKRGLKVYRLHPDGKKEIVTVLEKPVKFHRPEGVAKIK